MYVQNHAENTRTFMRENEYAFFILSIFSLLRMFSLLFMFSFTTFFDLE